MVKKAKTVRKTKKSGKSGNGTLIVSILVASVLISGSLVFLGIQMGAMSGGDLGAEIRTGIEDYIAEKEAEFREAQEEAMKPKVVEGDFTDDDAVLGDEDAPVTIVEFSDFQCPYCAKFYSGPYQDIKKNYVDTGKVKIVFRDYPLSFHAGALPAAMAAECVREQDGDSAFYAMHDAIFENQEVLSGVDVAGELASLAEGVGVDVGKFNECLESDKYKDEVKADMADGQKAGVTGTPAFLVNGQLVVGAQPYEVFEAVIEDAL